MYPKNKIISLIEIHSPGFIEKLKLKSSKINWVVTTSTSIESKAYRVGMPDSLHTAAISFLPTKKYDTTILIHSDRVHGKKDTIRTILHELLHVRFHKMLLPIFKCRDKTMLKKVYREEELIIQELERLFIL